MCVGKINDMKFSISEGAFAKKKLIYTANLPNKKNEKCKTLCVLEYY